MYSTVTKINAFFRTATRIQVDKLIENLVLTERQGKIFEMYYLKHQNRGFIADTLFMSQSVVSKELHAIREKIEKIGENLVISR